MFTLYKISKLLQLHHLSLGMRKPAFAYAKTKMQISFAVAAKLISAFVFATRIVRSLFYLNPKFQASSHLLWLHSPVYIGPGWKPRRPVFSERGSSNLNLTSLEIPNRVFLTTRLMYNREKNHFAFSPTEKRLYQARRVRKTSYLEMLLILLQYIHTGMQEFIYVW